MKCLVIIPLWLLLTIVTSYAQPLMVTNLRCNYRFNPLGIDAGMPHLGWQLKSDSFNVMQTAYRILVANDSLLLKKDIGNIWDSKKTNSDASIQVPYQGNLLKPATYYYWKVMVWDNKGRASGWSPVAFWQTGLYDGKDWLDAQWIAYDVLPDSAVIAPHVHQGGKKAWGPRKDILPLLRKEFGLEKPVKRATTFICGLGHFELSINGKKVGDEMLAPGWTDYSKHAQYVVYDVTKYLSKGANAMGIALGNGFYYIPSERYRKMTGGYGYPKAKAITLIEFADGTTQRLVTDASWKTDRSPTYFSSIFGGEDYDANLYQEGWDKAGFDDSKWKQAIITNGPELLQAQKQDPVMTRAFFSGNLVKQLSNGARVYDMRQNFSGMPAVRVQGQKGDTVRIYPAELLNPDGTANQQATGKPCYFTYVLSGQGEEYWFPRFSYTGFRYAEVYCIPKDSGQPPPTILDLNGLHIGNSAETTGDFVCSNDLFNKTHNLIDWAIRSNMMSVFTDCPHREKLGWLEQTHLMGASVQYRYHTATLNQKMITDMRFAQYPNGKVPEIAPELTVFTPPFDESPEWGSASIILPWYHYRWYGDKQTLAEAYPMMQQYAAYLKSRANDGILTHGLGDWFDIGPGQPGVSQLTKMGITATATYYYDLTILSKVATLLGKSADAANYNREAAGVKMSFNSRFFDTQKQQYDSASQTANAMALYMDLVEPHTRQAVLDALIRDITQRGYALTAGDIGYRYVLRALEQAGRSDVIFNMNSRDDVPGYGYQLKHGATALTESWQAYESVSNNHFMLGHLMEWFYGGLAGIGQAENSTAYKHLTLKPALAGDITFAEATIHSNYGQIKSAWKNEGNNWVWQVEVPCNSSAQLYIPARPGNTVTINGKKITGNIQNGNLIYQTGSGKYRIVVDKR